ncbi:hypothetical protein [Lederbergia citri]|uniref:Uncharacterized protein n=1 Tax=Lederbergia citri TaxID=2833580 RepID=A0A942TH11_9BACI|nr:hypothetical protein [Lederbergia citri]MBS4196437.1 hypothetical protein [Lederbergia citri]
MVNRIINDSDTKFVHLKLKLSTGFFQADSPRTQNGNPVYLNSGGEDQQQEIL